MLKSSIANNVKMEEKMIRKTLFLLLALALLCAPLVACGGTPAPVAPPPADDTPAAAPEEPADDGDPEEDVGDAGAKHTLKVWAAQEDQAMMHDLAVAFIEANPDYSVHIEFGVVGEPDAFPRFAEDPSAAADVFTFPNDQLRDFVRAGGLYEVQRNKDDIVARNGDGSIESATLDGALWAYPKTADNGYFLYYDKSVLTEQDIATLDGLMEAAQAADMKFLMNLDNNAWYLASFFLGAGCTIKIDANDVQSVDFNNANGLAAAEAIKALVTNPAYINGDDAVLTGGFGGSIAAGVSGIWNFDALSSLIGDNLGAAKLPTFTLNGQQVQMGSFGGYKLVGVNAMIDDPEKVVIAMDFADFITNEQSQLLRFETRGFGPSNNNAAANPAVLENIAVAALAAQGAYATSQNDVLGSFWEPAGAFGTALVNGDSTDLQELLDIMVKQINQ